MLSICGNSWSAALNSGMARPVSLLSFESATLELVASTYGGNVYRSNDFGQTWTPFLVSAQWYGVAISVTYKFSKHLSAEASYAYDQVDSQVPDTAGREASRHLAALGVKYSF